MRLPNMRIANHYGQVEAQVGNMRASGIESQRCEDRVNGVEKVAFQLRSLAIRQRFVISDPDSTGGKCAQQP